MAGKVHEAGHSENDLRQGVTALTSDGSITERPLEHGPFDEFYVGAEERQQYGIQDNETPYWARCPDFWMKRGENINRVKQIQGDPRRGGMGGRPVLLEGDPVRLGGGEAHDLVLMAIPNSIMERHQAEIDEGARAVQDELTETDDGWIGYKQIVPERGSRELNARMRAESSKNRELGLIGNNSPTSRMPYLQAERFMAKRQDEVLQKQSMLRDGGSHTTPNLDDFRKLMSGNDRKIHGMGNSGFGRNPNSAVAQAARKKAGG